MNWQQVFGSSNVSAIAYDAEKKECWVKFNEGSVYVYENVGPGVWEEFNNAQSKGRFVNLVLRRGHAYRKEASAEPATNPQPEQAEAATEAHEEKDLGYKT